MKVIILAGGYGTRLSEETLIKPKPMAEIGDKPILWHIMKNYSYWGFNDFIILLGYKGYYIKEYFANYFLHTSDVEIDLNENKLTTLNNRSENWKITLIDTGLDSMTGGRIKRAESLIGRQPFLLTYGDGVSDVNIKELIKFHNQKGALLTLTSFQPEGRFGALEFSVGDRVNRFLEKPKGDKAWLNGGFFVCEPEVFDYITDGDSTVFEHEPLENLAKDGKLFAYRHSGFWKCLDTLRDKIQLNELWNSGNAKWKLWE